MMDDTPLLMKIEENNYGTVEPHDTPLLIKIDDPGEDSDDWEDSDGEAWPSNPSRYVSYSQPKGQLVGSRLASEFTMGTGFHHLSSKGLEKIISEPAGTVLPTTENSEENADCYYTHAALELMAANGLEGEGLRVSKPCYVDKLLLVTDAPHEIHIYAGIDGGKPCVVGIALIRDGIVFTSGILEEETTPLKLQLNCDIPLLESIELQCCTWLEEGNRVEKKISYMSLSSGSDKLVFGNPQPAGFDGTNSLYSKVEAATGNLLISGIGYFDNKPICLQVVDLGNACEDKLDAINTCVYYNREVISTNCIRGHNKEVEFKESIATEDEAVWDVLLGCMDAVENSSPSYGELLPNSINLLERALAGNSDTTHAVFRLDRALTYTIQEKKSIKRFENDHLNFYSKLIPMKQMWSIFANAIERIKRINTDQPSLNSFSVAFLQSSTKNKSQAVFIFLTQATLLTLTLLHIWGQDGDLWSAPSSLRTVVALCGTVVVTFMVFQKKANFESFVTIFPDYRGTLFYYLDGLSNILGGALVAFSTLVLLLETTDNMDVVLNATALLFVLELDEVMVDSNPIYINGLYRAYFMKDILKNLRDSDKRYWDPGYLRRNRGEQYSIHLPSCSFLFNK